MRIVHNIAALNINSQLSSVNSKQMNSMEKLSSGFRINSAKDDAAGLAISEKMKAQIRGLDQASRNSQDGISLIQTAEGALNETHSIIQRMRELAVQGNNDTNTGEDRKKIKAEISQLTSEVDRIAEDTEFNSIKLLNAENTSSSPVKDHIVDMLKTGGWLELAEESITSSFGLTGNGSANLTVIFSRDGTSGPSAYVTGSTGTTDQSLTINLDNMSPSSGDNGDNGGSPANYTDRVMAHEMVHAVMNDQFTVSKTIDMQSWFKEGSAEIIHGGDERLRGLIANNIGTDIDATKLDSIVSRATDLLNGSAWNGDNTDYAAGYLIMSYVNDGISDAGNSITDVMSSIKSSLAAGDQSVEDAIVANSGVANFSTFVANFSSTGSDYVQTEMTFNYGSAETDTGSTAGSDHGGVFLNAEDVINESDADDTDGQPLLGFNVIFPGKKEQVSSIVVHTGANEGQEISIDLQDMRAGALGINSSEPFHINSYDKAIAKVSSYRSELGAYQNRLEHTIRNLESSHENLTAAESRIRDVDMAKEMMNQTKQSILAQASQAMLAKANQLPQSVLQLLS